MKINLAEYNLKSKILLAVLVCLSLAAAGAAVFKLGDYSVQQFFVLAMALAVSALIGQYQTKIPKTQTDFSVREMAVFWGTIWLGLPGAIFIAAGTSFIRCRLSPKKDGRAIFCHLIQICAAFAAANVFYLTLRSFAGFDPVTAGQHALAWYWFAAAAVAMAIAHYAVTAGLTSLTLKLERDCSFEELSEATFIAPTIAYLLSLAAIFLIHLAFLEFGLGFGWVILPAAIISHLAYKIHLNRLEQKTREIREASRVHLATVEALATAIDARDQMGFGHVRRTQIYAVALGEMLELSESDIQALNAGALLHDIGKLAVPDHILNKPGRLTPAELEKTKIHPSVGASILGKVDFSYPVVPTVKYHHECWDGSGYPDGLRGTEIPLTARILAVADAYDTLRGARPYRPAISREEARKFILNGAGTQFDPKIVDLFLRNLRKFEIQIADAGLAYKEETETAEDALIHQSDSNSKNYVEQIKSANREVYTLYELARVFSSSLNLEETIALFAEKIGELVPFDTLAIYLLDAHGNEAKAVYTEGKNKAALLNRTIKPGEGATGYVLKKHQSVCNVNPGLDFSFCQLDFVQDYSAMASLPLLADQKLLGAVSLYSCSLENYEDEHLRLLETVSHIGADTILKSLHHAETETRALTDPMTGLPNARSLQIQFDKEVARASRNGTSFQLLMLDLDGFKAVNDTFGHKSGDRLLKEISREMRLQLRDYDFLARYAGDEFVAIIPETDNVSVEEVCLRIEKAVREFILPVGDDQFARVGVSVGAASYPNSGETLDQIVIAADKAMYRVKAERKEKRTAEPPSTDERTPPGARPQTPVKTANPKPIAIRSTEPNQLAEQKNPAAMSDENFLVELDESHIISSAIN
jgi:diguanylate cyclase (GGDEF)-like protein/putative nucleotidyltransferase with HDIG domain